MQEIKLVKESKIVSDLVGDIYDASLDPALWPKVLGSIARFVGGLSATLFAKDARKQGGAVFFHDGVMEQKYQQLYFEKYAKFDPFTTAHYFSEIDMPMAATDVMPYDEFVDTRFYKEWVKPQGLVDFITSSIDRTDASVAMFGVFRHQRDGIAEDEAHHRMRLIAPHVRRAVLIGRAIDLKSLEAETFAHALDSLANAMFLVDATGRIVHANAAGCALMEARSIFRSGGGKLIANDAGTNRSLREIFLAAESGDTALGTKGIAMPLRAEDGNHYVAHVLPLTSGLRRRAGVTAAAVAAVFIQKTELAVSAAPEVIAKTYSLTPTELRVMLALAEVGGAPNVAELLGIAETTVKFHLRNLFDKTGVRRQADLIKLLAGFTSPVAS